MVGQSMGLSLVDLGCAEDSPEKLRAVINVLQVAVRSWDKCRQWLWVWCRRCWLPDRSLRRCYHALPRTTPYTMPYTMHYAMHCSTLHTSIHYYTHPCALLYTLVHNSTHLLLADWSLVSGTAAVRQAARSGGAGSNVRVCAITQHLLAGRNWMPR